MDIQFFSCAKCGQVMLSFKNPKAPDLCCNEPVKEMVVNSSEGAPEKHMPVYEILNDEVVVAVGSVAHPMTEDHYIEWIFLQTTSGMQSVRLHPGDAPEAHFPLQDDRLEHVYCLCNVHGMWKE